jgi:ParB/RepB/Spo0J family partition protein
MKKKRAVKKRGLVVKVQNIDLDLIDQNENSRVIYKATDLNELMHSLKRDGQLQPVGVRALPGGRFDAVFGNRRILAAKKLGWSSIDAHILEGVESDKDRDIINMLENLKRQNTSVAEDGRMFTVLKGYGLTEKEIAARLDISPLRVETALEVVSSVPSEYRERIVNRAPGKGMRGKIPASTAHAIMNLRKSHSLNRPQVRQLYKAAVDDEMNLAQISRVAPLLKSGLNVNQAIKIACDLRRVTLTLFMKEKTAARLEKKYGKSINAVLTEQIERNAELELYQEQKGFGGYVEKSTLAMAGAKGA